MSQEFDAELKATNSNHDSGSENEVKIIETFKGYGLKNEESDFNNDTPETYLTKSRRPSIIHSGEVHN